MSLTNQLNTDRYWYILLVLINCGRYKSDGGLTIDNSTVDLSIV